MLNKKRCRLCGGVIPKDRVDYCCGNDCNYCCDLCYLTDQILPPVESTRSLFGLPEKEMRKRFIIVTSRKYEAVYNVPFEEEEDMVMKDE